MEVVKSLENVQDGYAEVMLYGAGQDRKGIECLGVGYVERRDVVVIDSFDPEKYHTVERWFCCEDIQSAGMILPWDTQDVAGYATRKEAVDKFEWRG